jgi:hypothetical protein
MEACNPMPSFRVDGMVIEQKSCRLGRMAGKASKAVIVYHEPTGGFGRILLKNSLDIAADLTMISPSDARGA